jgi:hypothetical protein
MPVIDISDEHYEVLRSRLLTSDPSLSTASPRIIDARVEDIARRLIAAYVSDPLGCEAVFVRAYGTPVTDFTGWPVEVGEDPDPWENVESDPGEREAIQTEPRSCWSWVRAPAI